MKMITSKQPVRRIISMEDEEEKKPDILIEKKSFTSEDIKTSIMLLSTTDDRVLLKSIGTLSRYASKDDRYLEQYVNFEIYPKLVSLLHHTDIIIIKFTFKLLAMLAKNYFLPKFTFREIMMCNEMATRYYIETYDIFIKECCSAILLQHAKYNELLTNQIYSDELIRAIFDMLRKAADVDVLWNTLNLLHYLLDVEMAKEDIPRNEFFSMKVLICLLDCQQEGVKDLAINIFYKLSNWRSKDIIALFTKENVLVAMVNILFKDDRLVKLDKIFQIIENCVSNEECAIKFSKAVQFREFMGWLKKCSNRSLLAALPILTILTKIPQLRQYLFDLCFDQMVVSWMKYQHEKVILYILQMIHNLTEHKRCCQTFSKYVVIKTIKDYLLNESLPANPYAELALQVLKNLLVRSPEILDNFIACDGLSVVQDIFINKQKNISTKAYESAMAIMHYLLITPKCAEELLTVPVFQKMFYLYRRYRDLRFKVLNMVNSLVKHEVFRNYLIEYKKTEILLYGLKNDKTPFGAQTHMQVISNLIKYQELAYSLLDLELLVYLKAIRHQSRLKIVEDLIQELYDYCLTMKFHETHRLEAHNKIDEKFYLIQDETVSTASILSLDFGSSRRPVYVVSVVLVKVVREIEKSVTTWSSCTSVKRELTQSRSKRRILSITSNAARSNIRLKAVCEHGQIPENLLLKRMGCTSKDVQFYEDYCLERYILNLMRELYYSDNAPQTLKERIEYIAKFVARQMSGIHFNLKESEKRPIFNEHLSKLQQSVGMAVIPIGYLRMGYYCERALLFKVLCDNVCVPTTLCKRDADIYWNEVHFSVIHDGKQFINQENRVYIVDLMCNVGSLIPLHSLEASEYLCIDSCENKT